MKALRLVIWLLCAAPMVAAADGQSPRARGRIDLRSQERPRFDLYQPPDDDEWEQIKGWMKTNCPNRYNVVTRLENNRREQFAAAQRLVTQTYRRIQMARMQSPELADAITARAAAEDHVFGAQIALRKALRGNGSEPEARDRLHASIEKLFEAELAIKKTRLKRLEQEVKAQKDLLEDQQSRHDQLVEQWFNNRINQIRPGLGETRDLNAAPLETQAAPADTRGAAPDPDH